MVDPLPGDSAERERLILDHVPLLKHIVGRMSFDAPGGVDRDDLYGFGMLGLIAAADAWDTSRGLKFSTFAYTKIRGAILDELRRHDFLPRGRRERVRELEVATQALEQRHGGPPSIAELAEELGWETGEIDETLVAASCAAQASLDDGVGEGLGALLSNPRSDDPAGSAERAEMQRVLVEEIAALSEQEKSVITLYYAEEMLLREIAEILGVTESRVSQIHTRALYHLNRALRARTGASIEEVD